MTPIGKDSSGPEAHSWESSCTEPCPQDQGAVLAVDASTTHRRVPGAARAAECPPDPQGVQRQTNPPPGRPGSPGLAPDHPQQAPPRPREAPASAHSPDVENFPEARTLLAEGGSTHMLRPSLINGRTGQRAEEGEPEVTHSKSTSCAQHEAGGGGHWEGSMIRVITIQKRARCLLAENFLEARTLLAEGGSTHMLRPSLINGRTGQRAEQGEPEVTHSESTSCAQHEAGGGGHWEGSMIRVITIQKRARCRLASHAST